MPMPLTREKLEKINAAEDRAILRGFIAARHGQRKDQNPYPSHPVTEYLGWENGWDSWEQKHLPFPIYKMYAREKQYTSYSKAQEIFKQEGTLPAKVENILKLYTD